MAKRSSSRARPIEAVVREAPPSRPDTAGLYATLLTDLNSTIDRMTSPRFDALLQSGSAEDRLRAMREMAGARLPLLVADGGIRAETVPLLREAGAAGIVPGSLICSSEDAAATAAWLKSL